MPILSTISVSDVLPLLSLNEDFALLEEDAQFQIINAAQQMVANDFCLNSKTKYDVNNIGEAIAITSDFIVRSQEATVQTAGTDVNFTTPFTGNTADERKNYFLSWAAYKITGGVTKDVGVTVVKKDDGSGLTVYADEADTIFRYFACPYN